MEEKVSLPIKTKIAAILILITCGLGILVSFFFLLAGGGCPACYYEAFPYSVGAFCISLLGIIFSIFLFIRKKIGWWLSVFYLFIFVLTAIFLPHFGYNFLLIIPFILLLLDRKNFFKVAR